MKKRNEKKMKRRGRGGRMRRKGREKVVFAVSIFLCSLIRVLFFLVSGGWFCVRLTMHLIKHLSSPRKKTISSLLKSGEVSKQSCINLLNNCRVIRI